MQPSMGNANNYVNSDGRSTGRQSTLRAGSRLDWKKASSIYCPCGIGSFQLSSCLFNLLANVCDYQIFPWACVRFSYHCELQSSVRVYTSTLEGMGGCCAILGH